MPCPRGPVKAKNLIWISKLPAQRPQAAPPVQRETLRRQIILVQRNVLAFYHRERQVGADGAAAVLVT
jgi:hypothetical protein